MKIVKYTTKEHHMTSSLNWTSGSSSSATIMTISAFESRHVFFYLFAWGFENGQRRGAVQILYMYKHSLYPNKGINQAFYYTIVWYGSLVLCLYLLVCDTCLFLLFPGQCIMLVLFTAQCEHRPGCQLSGLIPFHLDSQPAQWMVN